MTLTVERLREVLDYDSESGRFVWKTGLRAGKNAGCKHWTGYLFIKIDQVTHLAHRLAWAHFHGEWPNEDIDHRNLDKTDNRIANLRGCNDRLNQANTARRGAAGLKGVTWAKSTRKWQASIKADGRPTYLGQFDCIAAAHLAYVVAADKTFGEYARTA